MTTPLSRLRDDLCLAGLGWLTPALADGKLSSIQYALVCAFVAGKYHGDPRPSAVELRELFPAPTPEH